jgi:sugar (pentulose or hexulose) kinase
VSFAIKDVITVMEESGAAVGELRVSGSAAANDVLNQIKADISGREVLSPAQKDAELLGLAVIGACVLGKYASFSEAASALVQIEGHWRPDEKKAPVYERLFKAYRESYQALKNIDSPGIR